MSLDSSSFILAIAARQRSIWMVMALRPRKGERERASSCRHRRLHLDGDGAAPQEGRAREGLVVPAQEASSPAVELSVGLGILSIA